MSFTRRISFGVLLALLVFVLRPDMAQAMCDPPNDGERSPDAENMGIVSLSADHNTLTITNAKWYPGSICPDPYAGKDGSAVAFVDQTPIQIVGPSQWYLNTAGPFYYTTSLNVSSLPNGTYSLAFLVDSTYGDPYFDQLNQNFTINRAPVNYTLTVARAGSASSVGSVASSPAGITCGGASPDCSQSYSSGTSVTLTATPGASTFAGWSGGGCSGTGNCVVTMNAAKAVTATFNTAGGTNRTLTVSKIGTGTGVVSSTGAINCGSTCSASIADGNSITLYANPSAGSTFAGWSGGGCSGTGSCAVTMDANKTVTATFNTSGATGCAQVSVASNVPTTWWIGGPMTDGQPIVQNTPSSGRSYTTDTTGNALPTGSYSGFAATDPVAFGTPAGGWYGGVATPNNSQWCTGGNDISWTITFKRDGTCGTANGVATYTQPSTNLCSTGVSTAVSGSASQWTWSCTGEYNGTTASCAAPKKYKLTTTKSGAGSGTVTSNPAGGINCGTGTGCWEEYNYNASVTLTATPSAGETFLGWSGGGCSGTGTCTVTMTGDKTVDANFGHGMRTLTVTKNGTAASGGRVTSSPTGIDCGADCSQNYTYGLTVSLTPGVVAGSGAKFVSWSGACTGSGACTPTMTMARSVTATYNQTYNLAITKAGTGTGTVTAPVGTTVDGISCGTNCSEGYWVNTVVAPTPTPAAGSVFAGWSGDADCADGSLTMSAARSCIATFTLSTPLLTVTKAGTGVGTVTSNPGGINCGADCTENYTSGTSVTLTPTPTTGSTFGGWGGDCAGTGSCVVSMTQARNVTATFTLNTYTVTGTAGAGGTISPASRVVNHGATTTFTVTPNAGYTASASGCGGSLVGTTYTTGVITANCTVTAVFTPTYTVTGTGGGAGGTITPASQVVNSGSTAVLTVTPTAGYTASASGCGGSLVGTTYTTAVVTANCTVTAVFISSPTCSPASQNIGVKTDASLTAFGGVGGYTWTAIGGTPNSGSGSPFTTSYATEGTNSVTVRSGGAPESSPCLVVVEGNITVTSNISTAWDISGPVLIQEPGPSNGDTYGDITPGGYTISADKPGFTLAVTSAGGLPNAQSQTIGSSGGSIEFNLTYTPDGTSGSVDLRADGLVGPIDVIRGATVDLTWDTVSAEIDSCEGSLGVGTWATNNPKADDSGTETSAAILADTTTFTLTCTNTLNQELMWDSVVVTAHTAACFDGISNEVYPYVDGLVDYAGADGIHGGANSADDDPGCDSCAGPECPTGCLGAACDDNEDNYVPKQCEDGDDNELPTGDGKIDADDPGCWTDESDSGTYNHLDDDERDTPVAQCNDTFDNDGDTKFDYAGKDGIHGGANSADDDPGCTDPLDVSELDDPDVEEF